MPVPALTHATSRLRQIFGLALMLCLASAPLFARGPETEIRIPLDQLGFQPQLAQLLMAGSSVLTLNYVDNQHLLLTFGVHRLMERIGDDPPDDADHMVEAVLLEVPSGHVLGRTEWRFHDNGQYLWSLGHGRFMLRVRDRLTTFAPMVNLASRQPFRQRPLLTMTRRIGVLLLAPESDLLVVESVEPTPPPPPPTTPLFGPTPKPQPAPLGRPGELNPVTLGFYRLILSEDSDEVKAALAGVAHSVTYGSVPATGAGHLEVVVEGPQKWGFSFHSYGGAVKELSGFVSTCRPTVRFVSDSEFVAFGCHGGSVPQILGGFNMRGEEMWEQNLSGSFMATSFVFSPSSGRFALGRILGEVPADESQIHADSFSGQSVVVYQAESGKQLMHADCEPIARAGQNFTLSPDGMGLAVIHGDHIEIYGLPPLSSQDQADLKEARAMVPGQSILPIDFGVPSPAPANDTQASGPSSDVSTGSNASATPAKAAPPEPERVGTLAPSPATASRPAAAGVPAGDAATDQPRRPPTLYTLPGDSAEKDPK